MFGVRGLGARHRIATAAAPASPPASSRRASALLASNSLLGLPERCAFLRRPRRRAASPAIATSSSGVTARASGRARSRTRARRAQRHRAAIRARALQATCSRSRPARRASSASCSARRATSKHALALARSVADATRVGAALERARAAWDALLGASRCKTPDRALDLLLNRWLLYQVLSCRLWARSAFYQSAARTAFATSCRTCSRCCTRAPSCAREHLLRCGRAAVRARATCSTGGTPRPARACARTARTTCCGCRSRPREYVRVTGDRAVLDEQVPFLEERQLQPDEHDIYSVPRVSAESGLALRALRCARSTRHDRGPARPAADARRRLERRHEPRRRARQRRERVARLVPGARAGRLAPSSRAASTTASAPGRCLRATRAARRRRSTRTPGTAPGTGAPSSTTARRSARSSSAECRIDAIAQSWAVLSGCARDPRARAGARAGRARCCVERRHDAAAHAAVPGRDARPRLHPRLSARHPRERRPVHARRRSGRCRRSRAAASDERAHALLSMLNPIHHARDAAEVARYAVEPYVVAADVYSRPSTSGAAAGPGTPARPAGCTASRSRTCSAFACATGTSTSRLRGRQRSRATASCTGAAPACSTSRSRAPAKASRSSAGAWLDGQAVSADAVRIPDDGERHTLRVVTALLGTPPARADAGSASGDAELPEVEHNGRQLERWLRGRRIVKASALDRRVVRPVAASTFARALAGRTVARVERRGKWIRIALDDERKLFIHLGMTGWFEPLPVGDPPQAALERVRLELVRRPECDGGGLYRPLGPDRARARGHRPLPSARARPACRRHQSDRARGCPRASQAQHDQGGAARSARPRRDRQHPGDRGAVEGADRPALGGGRPHACARAPARARAPLDDRAPLADLAKGEGGVENPFRVYGRKGEPCPRCRTPLSRIELAGRTTTFCEGCQRRLDGSNLALKSDRQRPKSST